MVWWLYNVLFAVLYLLVLPRFLFRMLRRGGYGRGFMERLGVFTESKIRLLEWGRRVWIHAVSVGEVQVAFRFMEALRHELPGISFAVSVTTSTACRIAEKRIGPDDVVFYFPLDLPIFLNRVFRQVRPLAVILTESELWPNLLRTAARRRVPVMLINGRISPSSYRGYRLLRGVFGRVLQVPRALLVQTEADGGRLGALGVPGNRIHEVGSMKYDDPGVDEAGRQKVSGLLSAIGLTGSDRVVLVGGSTWPGEEQVLMEIVRNLQPSFPGVRLVLVPRHVERRREVEEIITGAGFRCVLRSMLDTRRGGAWDGNEVLLVDTTGELRYFYACASLVFVGKSLTMHGGQNIIEPAVLGKPILVGPNMENFPEIIEDFRRAKAILQVADAAGLERAVAALLTDPVERNELAERAKTLVAVRRGALDKSLAILLPILREAVRVS